MSNPAPDLQRLGAALEHFRATRSAYQSTSDQAMTALLLALGETLIALRSGQTPGQNARLAQALDLFRITRPQNLSTSDQAQSDLLSLLGEQALRLSTGATAPAPATAPADTLDALQSQIDVLQLTLNSQNAAIKQLSRQLGVVEGRTPSWAANQPPVQAPLMRPVEYWAEHVPDYGDGLSGEQLREHLSRPRVRPEDVVLTPEDQRRIQQREWRPPKTWYIDMYGNRREKLTLKAELALLALLLGFLLFVGFQYLQAALFGG